MIRSIAKHKKISLYVCFLLILVVAGCAKTAQKEILDEHFYFERGMKFMKKKDYINAIQNFQTVVDSHPGSAIVDHAQFMLGEAHYMNEDYITAAYEYERVYMDFPSSKFAAEAWYKKAMCWFMESPRANLDQENTNLAIDEFKRFIENFPYNTLVEDAKEKIKELREKLAYKDYLNAEQYRKMKAYDASLIYYDSVIKTYPQSVWINYSRFGIGQVHMKLMYIELKKLERLEKSGKADQIQKDKIIEDALDEFEQAKNMFTMVINSDAEQNLKKKVSGKISELDNIEVLK